MMHVHAHASCDGRRHGALRARVLTTDAELEARRLYDDLFDGRPPAQFDYVTNERIHESPGVFARAVAETRRLKIEGRIKKSIGGALGDLFHRFRAASFAKEAAS